MTAHDERMAAIRASQGGILRRHPLQPWGKYTTTTHIEYLVARIERYERALREIETNHRPFDPLLGVFALQNIAREALADDETTDGGVP